MLCNSCPWYEYGHVEAGQCGNKNSRYYEEDVAGTTTCGLEDEE